MNAPLRSSALVFVALLFGCTGSIDADRRGGPEGSSPDGTRGPGSSGGGSTVSPGGVTGSPQDTTGTAGGAPGGAVSTALPMPPGVGGAPVLCRPGDMPSAAALPRTFQGTCGGCHSAYGASFSSQIPNLFEFKGTSADFIAHVRKGGKIMAAYDESAISASDLEAIFGFFRAGKPLDGLACGSGTMGSVVVAADTCTGAAVEIAPLFAVAAERRPLVWTDERRWLITRGAGRVRGRHELEGDFSPFHPLYFENRSYEFLIEDSIPAGGTTIKFTYLPVGEAADSPQTNFRHWKIYNNGNVFYSNVSLSKITSKRWEFTVTSNARERRAMRRGDVLEFEFGIFFNATAVRGRTSYYTDTFRYRVGDGGLTSANSDPAVGALGPAPAGMSGGATTIPFVVAEPELYFSQMAINIQPENIQKFLEGRRLFHTDFVTGNHTESGNPVFTEQGRKAGPLFNQTTCTGCHVHNGRGAPPEAGAAMSTMVVKIFGGEVDPRTGLAPHPVYGKQLHDRGVTGMTVDGEATVAYQTLDRTLKDGTAVSLLKPTVSFRRTAGAAPDRFSPRVARQLVGLGLLEAVSEGALVALSDAGDCNKDGISGRPNVAWDPETGRTRLGRFGWKASKVSVKHQVAEALLLDVGVTSSVFPEHECGPGATCPKAAPEISDDDLERLVSYVRDLGVPPRRKMDDARVARGEIVFAEAGCARCHTPTLVTAATHPFAELRNQVIHPYTDLLLHDLGPDLADASQKEYVAEAGEWRTPPLWGIGLIKTVSGHTRFLHDGRARNLLEAILWHGGEAQGARDRFSALSAADREALVAFLESL